MGVKAYQKRSFIALFHFLLLFIGFLGFPILKALIIPSLAYAQTNGSQTSIIFGPKEYLRTSGPPNTYTETFVVPDNIVSPFYLHVSNGTPDGKDRISSGWIRINGVQVVSPSELNQKVSFIYKEVDLNKPEENTLEVTLTSGPGGFITLTLSGTHSSIVSVDPSRGYQGTSQTVSILGNNTNFQQGTTQVTFGPGISVGDGPEGGPGPVSVTGPTTATAEIKINPDAALGPRTLSSSTGPDWAYKEEGYTVIALQPPGSKNVSVANIAGSGGPGFADGPGNIALFNNPGGIAVDKEGNLYVADSGNHRIRKILYDGIVTTLAGNGSPGFSDGEGSSAQFNNPQGLALDNAGNVYVADTNNHRIRRIAPDGTVSTLSGNGTAGYQDGPGLFALFNKPKSIAVDGNNNVYIGDEGNNRVRKIDSYGYVTTLSGSGIQGFADGPAFIAQFASLAGITVDGAGNVYIADSLNNRIRKIDPSGNVSTLTGNSQFGFLDGPVDVAQFANPSGIAADTAGNIYVADTFNSLIRRINPDGQVTTLAGTGERGTLDGDGTVAQFKVPKGLTVNGQGLAFIADTGNQLIRKLSIRPVIARIDPSSGAQGQTIQGFTIEGTDLIGASSIEFILNGSKDTEITASEIRVDPSANKVTAILLISSRAALGPRIVTVTTSGGTSSKEGSSSNTFTVTPGNPLDLEPDPLVLGVGEKGLLTIRIPEPAPPGGVSVSLESAAPWIATVTSPVIILEGSIYTTAIVTGVGEGTTSIIANSPNYIDKISIVKVVVQPPTITGFSPTSGHAGIPVTITGTGFGASIQDNRVAFTGLNDTKVEASITSASTTQLIVSVPEGAVTGPITVTTPGGTVTSQGSFVVLPREDFSLTIGPASATVNQGNSVTYKVSVMGSGGFTGLVSLNISDLPTGATATLDPPVVSPGQIATLMASPSNTTPIGQAFIKVTGTTSINGTLTSRFALATLDVIGASTTSLSGRVLDTEGRPLKGVMIIIGDKSTSTDESGNFIILDPPIGEQIVIINGTHASREDAVYPVIPVTVTIVAGKANTLGFTPYLHAQKGYNLTPIDPNRETVVTDPDIPGFEMRVPAGTQIIGWDGRPNLQVSVMTVPIDRLPIKPPPTGLEARTVYMFYFGKQGGGTPSQPVPVALPNDIEGLPGERLELWYFDESPNPGEAPNDWRLAGTATVTPDGRQVVTDSGVGIPRFCCGAVVIARRLRQARPPQLEAPNLPQGGQGPKGGEPVDLVTGLFVLEKTDMILPGRIPVAFTRTYRSLDQSRGAFGIGTSSNFDLYLQWMGPDMMILFLPGNSRVPFARQADGTYTNTTEPSFRGARLDVSIGPWSLRLKDGTVYRFNSSGWLIEQQRNGNTITITRNSLNNITRTTEPAGRAIEVSTDSQGRITSISDPIGRVVVYTYDAGGRLETVTDPLGGVTRYSYDSSNRMTSITDPKGITFIQNQYDSNGRVSQQTQADGGIWRFDYQVTAGYVTETRVTDPRGNTITHRFNSYSYPISITDALGQSTIFERAVGSNLLLSTTDPLGRKTSFSYDEAGNVISITDPAGSVRTFTYEPKFNRLTGTRDPFGNQTTFSYDSNGNLTTITDPLGNTTLIAYNQYGQPSSTTDPLGNTTRFEYDGDSNLIAIIDPLGNRTTRSYDTVSRLISQTDPLGRSTYFIYDELNRITQIIDAMDGGTLFSYDSNGNLLQVTDALGHNITHEYDSMDRLSRRIDQLGRVETFTYDGLGNLMSTTDRKGQTSTFTYDALNRRVGATYADGAVATFTYDAAGRLVLADDTADPHRPIILTYDFLDRLITETTAMGTISYQYDPLGRRTQMIVSGQAPLSYIYDDNSRLRTITQAPVTPVTIEYDAAGRRTLLALPNGVSTEYQYDAASRLTSLIYRSAFGLLGNLTYQYDPTGNRIGMGGSFARTLLPDPVASATYDTANQQLSFGNKTMTYDANGNLATLTDPSGTTTFTWDARNRLIGMSGPTVMASFAYDSVGRRTTKAVNGETREYQYDGGDLIREIVNGSEATYLMGLDIDDPITRTSGGASEHYLLEGLGSVLALTEGSGQVATSYTYAPFGHTTIQGAATQNPFGFTAREEEGTGLYYYRARYYHPTLQRFISEDPIGLRAADPNFYVYVGNSPTAQTDPFGLWKTGDHSRMTRNTLSRCGFGPADVGIATRQNWDLDFLEPLNNAAHYMPGYDGPAERFIQENYARAVQAELHGDRKLAMKHLGRALHTIQDKWSHAKNTPPGGWQQHYDPRHWTDPDNPAAHPSEFARAQQETEELVKRFLRDVQRGRGQKPGPIMCR